MKLGKLNLKLIIITFLSFLLLIPVVMIDSLINERYSRKNKAISEVSQKWGGSQNITGPILTVPYKITWQGEKKVINTAIKYAHFLPQTLDIVGNLIPEIKHKGIYKVILYKSLVDVKGKFSFPTYENLGIAYNDFLWQDAFISVGISYMVGIKDLINLKWNDQLIEFKPDTKISVINSGVNAVIPLDLSNKKKDYNFSFNLNLNGSEELSVIPCGQESTLKLKSNWANPNFIGAFLPNNSITTESFEADWKVLNLNRNYPQEWLAAYYLNGNNYGKSYDLNSSNFGVKLLLSVDEYQKTLRSIKYAIMFIVLTFLIFFFSEILNKEIKVHPIQYLLVGFALCVFYLLLLSLSEYIKFGFAYIIAGISTSILIAFYSISVLKSKKLSFLTGSILLLLYTFMYVLLVSQDYSLLMGSFGLFIILGFIMYLSRNIDWYSIQEK